MVDDARVSAQPIRPYGGYRYAVYRASERPWREPDASPGIETGRLLRSGRRSDAIGSVVHGRQRPSDCSISSTSLDDRRDESGCAFKLKQNIPGDSTWRHKSDATLSHGAVIAVPNQAGRNHFSRENSDVDFMASGIGVKFATRRGRSSSRYGMVFKSCLLCLQYLQCTDQAAGMTYRSAISLVSLHLISCRWLDHFRSEKSQQTDTVIRGAPAGTWRHLTVYRLDAVWLHCVST